MLSQLAEPTCLSPVGAMKEASATLPIGSTDPSEYDAETSPLLSIVTPANSAPAAFVGGDLRVRQRVAGNLAGRIDREDL